MLRTIAGIVLILWLIGWLTGFGGGLIHLILLAVAILIALDLLAARSKL